MTLDPGLNPADEHAQRAAQVRQALERLSPEIRDILVLTYFGGRSSSDVATTLGLTLQTVRRRISQGLRTLGTSLDDNPVRSADPVFTPQEQRRRA